MSVFPRGYVFWITGLSGSGKSTVGQLLANKLQQAGHPTLYLDGDVLREIFGNKGGHSKDERQQLAMTYARLCREVSKQQLNVVCATVSMFHDVRKWNRNNIKIYYEIYLRVPIKELSQRDPKGIYAAFNTGNIKDVVGLDIEPELPETPDLIIENFGNTTPETAVQSIINRFSLSG